MSLHGARGCRSKALRLYDELGVLTPSRVDSESGYRYYDVAQLEDARLVAMLRQLEFPLAEIKELWRASRLRPLSGLLCTGARSRHYTTRAAIWLITSSTD